MSKLTISNLEETLERSECADVKGGIALPLLGELPLYGYSNVLASINSATVQQNAVNFIMSGSGGDGDTGNQVGSATFTPINISSPATVVQGGLPV